MNRPFVFLPSVIVRGGGLWNSPICTPAFSSESGDSSCASSSTDPESYSKNLSPITLDWHVPGISPKPDNYFRFVGRSISGVLLIVLMRAGWAGD